MHMKKHSVLVVDDQEFSLAIMEDMLSPTGMRILKAGSGRDALEIVKTMYPDIILLDIVMQDMTGYDVCREIKLNPATSNIPIVMVTAMEGTDSLVKALEYGADDFLTKPINRIELLARVRSLLNKKYLDDQLKSSYAHINNLIAYAESKLSEMGSDNPEIENAQRNLIEKMLRHRSGEERKPAHILLGRYLGNHDVAGVLYSRENGEIVSQWVETKLRKDIEISGRYFFQAESSGTLVGGSCDPDEAVSLIGGPLNTSINGLHNFIVGKSLTNDKVVASFNYVHDITPHDINIMRSFSLFFQVFNTISGHVGEVDRAFRYVVNALARAAEANDEETGNHILRVNEYARVISEEMSMSKDFIRDIGFFAQMHDVGNIHMSSDVLRKTCRLSDEEHRMIKQHTFYGAMILGDEPHLGMAKDIALYHHEHFDGSGYPKGLKGKDIPISARIVALVDVYDALRSRRSYKAELSHGTALDIIMKGDHKTTPEHFDPDVVDAFLKKEKQLEDMYSSFFENEGSVLEQFSLS